MGNATEDLRTKLASITPNALLKLAGKSAPPGMRWIPDHIKIGDDGAPFHVKGHFAKLPKNFSGKDLLEAIKAGQTIGISPKAKKPNLQVPAMPGMTPLGVTPKADWEIELDKADALKAAKAKTVPLGGGIATPEAHAKALQLIEQFGPVTEMIASPGKGIKMMWEGDDLYPKHQTYVMPDGIEMPSPNAKKINAITDPNQDMTEEQISAHLDPDTPYDPDHNQTDGFNALLDGDYGYDFSKQEDPTSVTCPTCFKKEMANEADVQAHAQYHMEGETGYDLNPVKTFEFKVANFANLLEMEGKAGAYPNSEPAYIKKGNKYTKVDKPKGQGKFMVAHDTGVIYGILSYGQINKKKTYGTVDTVQDWNWPTLGAPTKKPKTTLDGIKEKAIASVPSKSSKIGNLSEILDKVNAKNAPPGGWKDTDMVVKKHPATPDGVIVTDGPSTKVQDLMAKFNAATKSPPKSLHDQAQAAVDVNAKKLTDALEPWKPPAGNPSWAYGPTGKMRNVGAMGLEKVMNELYSASGMETSEWYKKLAARYTAITGAVFGKN